MWKLLTHRKVSRLRMASKGDCYLIFVLSTPENLGCQRLLEGNTHVRISEDSKSWGDVISKNWADTGHECETLKEMYDVVHMVKLMED